MNLSVLLADRAAKFGHRQFLYFERQPVANASKNAARHAFRQTLTFRELDDRVNQACHYLSSQGLTRGDVFNLHLPNCPAFLILWLAGARLGAIMMPTNVLASADELGYLLEHSSSKIAFTTAEHQVMLAQCGSKIDGLEKIILCDPYSADPAADSFEALIQGQPVAACDCPLGETDMAAIMYTSGTTSKPKGVMVTHANYLTAGQTVADAIELAEDDRHFVVLPLFHGNAQYFRP
jgi:crotonobetaine/carnitine-CoA ligase